LRAAWRTDKSRIHIFSVFRIYIFQNQLRGARVKMPRRKRAEKARTVRYVLAKGRRAEGRDQRLAGEILGSAECLGDHE
jgi:hypothetical protein